MTTKFDRRFTGPAYTQIRQQIRKAADDAMPACADQMRAAVMAVGHGTTLTEIGRATLAAVANDYAAIRKDWEPRCNCDSCVDVGFAGLRH